MFFWGKTPEINMTFSVTTNIVEFHDINQLLKFEAGMEVEMLVWISSFCILTTNIAIVKYECKTFNTLSHSNKILHRRLITINGTFINLLVLMDSINAIGHIPIVFQLIL